MSNVKSIFSDEVAMAMARSLCNTDHSSGEDWWETEDKLTQSFYLTKARGVLEVALNVCQELDEIATISPNGGQVFRTTVEAAKHTASVWGQGSYVARRVCVIFPNGSELVTPWERVDE